jgi:hypothetical protein
MTQPGHLDFFTVDLLTGWAWDPARPDEPVDVAVLDGEQVVLRFKADRFRQDLAKAGIGNGRHAFSLDSLHAALPWSRRNLAVVRAHDGTALIRQPRSLIATGSALLHLPRDGGMPCIAFGGGLYPLAPGTRAADLAAWLSVTVPEEGDDRLPLLGQAHWRTDGAAPALLLEPLDAPMIGVPMDPTALAGPQLHLCRGRTTGRGWVRPELVLEVENAIGLELLCMLPGPRDLGPKTLRVTDAGGHEQVFDLPRGRRASIAIAVTTTERHRLQISTEPEPAHGHGFQLYGLDAIGRDAGRANG